MNATTFYGVVRDWENGLEPYKSVSPSNDISNGFSEMIASASVRLGRLLGLADFLSLRLSHRFVRNCLAVVAFYLTFVCLPPLNTGEENPNGYYVHNFLTDTVEYRINGKGVLLYK